MDGAISDKIADSVNSFPFYLSDNYSSSTIIFSGFAFILFLGGFLLWRRDVYRPSQMKKIAEKYGLDFTGTDKDQPLDTIKNTIFPDYRENIISGRIKGEDILIYDWTKLKLPGFIPHRIYILRCTVVSINGSEKRLNNWHMNGVASIKKIDAILTDLVKV